MLKAIIVEDEYLPARRKMAFLVGQHSNIEIVASFEDGLEAFKYLQDHEVDVVFLDIQIPAIDGLLLAKNLHKSSHPPHIVFVTAYKEFAVEAFELEAFDYILKPYNEPRLINLLQKLELAGKSQPQGAESGTPQNRTVNLVKGSASSSPLRADLLRGSRREADHVYTRTDRYVMTMTLSEFVSRLPAEGFFRCHRSYCVNINKIREIVPWFNSTYLIRLHDLPFEVPVSRSNIKAFRQLMRL